MSTASTTCHGIGFTRFPAGANLLLVTCPALVLQTIMTIESHESDETEATDKLMCILVPLLDAVQAQPHHGVLRGTAAETARPTRSETLPWRWEGRVRIAHPGDLVIDSGTALSAVASKRPPDANTAAFLRAHPWLNHALVQAEDRTRLVESLTDPGLEAQLDALCPHQLDELLRVARSEQGSADRRDAKPRDARPQRQALVELLRTCLTAPRFPTLALALPDTSDALEFLTRLVDELVDDLLRDTATALIPS